MRLGWAVGEPLVVEEETLNRLVLNRIRVLVLLPFGLKCPGSIKVVSGSRSFPVSVREDSTPINPAGISWRLGIDDRFVSDSSFLDHNEDRHGMNEGDRMVGGNVSVLKKGGEVALKTLINNSDAELDNLIQTNMDLACEKDMGHYNHDVEDSLDRPITANEYPKSIISKGKGILSKKQSQKIVGPIVHNGKIVLDKRLEYGYERVGEGDDSDSSSNDDRIAGQTSHFPIVGGEPSIVSSSQLKGGNNIIDLDIGAGKKRNCYTKKNGALVAINQDTTVGRNTGNLEEQRGNNLEVIADPINALEARISSPDISVSHISETQFQNMLSEVEEPESTDMRLQSKKQLRKNAYKSRVVRSQSMKHCRRSQMKGKNGSGRSRVSVLRKRWNLEEEVSKVIEKGKSLGYFNLSNSGKDGGGISAGGRMVNSGAWSLSEEVAKILETGKVMRFDYNGLGLLPSVDPHSFQTKDVGVRPIPRSHHAGMEKATSSQCLQTGLLAAKAKLGLIEKRNNKAARKIKMIGVSAKGKKKWVGKKKEKVFGWFVHNGNLNIDKTQCLVRGGTTNSEESSSSSEDSLGITFFKDSFKSKGECSNRHANQVQFLNRGDGLSDGPPKPKRFSFPSLSNSPDSCQSKDIGLELCVDLGLVEVSSSKLLSHNHLKPILEDVDEEICISSEVGDEEVRVREEVLEMIDKEANLESCCPIRLLKRKGN
ncbi:hypothetical protein LWI29_038223 [Acer saccharum]|uniref:Uncharacterized protein n=1 Tax=Acer saccharum TaxID=4024 RepID=A0AA39S1G7_ACESA|nr:hypothetical protein LWI29_038223 [Acer saccharum]